MILLRVIVSTLFSNHTMIMSNTRTRITSTSNPSIKIFTDRGTSQFVQLNGDSLSFITRQRNGRITLTSETAFKISEINGDITNAIQTCVPRLQIRLKTTSHIRESLLHKRRGLMQKNTRDATDIGSKHIQVLMSNVNSAKEITKLIKRLGIRLNITLNRNRSTHDFLPPSH